MPTPDRLGDALTRTLLAVVAYRRMTGRCPSVREVQRMVGVASPSTIHERLLDLRDLGLVEWEPGRRRTLRARVELVVR